MRHVISALALLLGGMLGACSDSTPDAGATGAAPAPAEHTELENAVKAPLDQAAGVNSLIDQQDAAQRKAMDEQGR